MKKEKTPDTRRRSKKHFDMACWILCLAGLAVCIFGIAGILPRYGEWARSKTDSEVVLHAVPGPACVTVAVHYETEIPQGIRLAGRSGLSVVDLTDDPETKTARVTADIPAAESDEEAKAPIVLHLIPGTNKNLSYEFILSPSYKYVSAKKEFHTAANGDIWLDAWGSYGRLRTGGKIRISVYFEGASYKPLACEFEQAAETDEESETPPDPTEESSAELSVAVNLSLIARARNIRLEDTDRVSVYITADGQTPEHEPMAVADTGSVLYNDMPPFDLFDEFTFPTSQTESYLDATVRGWRETTQ